MQLAQFKGRSLYPSLMIRFLTRSVFSHGAIRFDAAMSAAAVELASEDRDFAEKIPFRSPGCVIEAWSPGGVRNVHSLSARHERGTTVDVFDFKEPLTHEEHREVLKFLVGEIGVPYGGKNVLRFLTRRPGNLDDTWFCSELQFVACQKANRILLERTEAWEVPPGWVPRSPILKPVATFVTG